MQVMDDLVEYSDELLREEVAKGNPSAGRRFLFQVAEIERLIYIIVVEAGHWEEHRSLEEVDFCETYPGAAAHLVRLESQEIEDCMFLTMKDVSYTCKRIAEAVETDSRFVAADLGY